MTTLEKSANDEVSAPAKQIADAKFLRRKKSAHVGYAEATQCAGHALGEG